MSIPVCLLVSPICRSHVGVVKFQQQEKQIVSTLNGAFFFWSHTGENAAKGALEFHNVTLRACLQDAHNT